MDLGWGGITQRKFTRSSPYSKLEVNVCVFGTNNTRSVMFLYSNIMDAGFWMLFFPLFQYPTFFFALISHFFFLITFILSLCLFSRHSIFVCLCACHSRLGTITWLLSLWYFINLFVSCIFCCCQTNLIFHRTVAMASNDSESGKKGRTLI